VLLWHCMLGALQITHAEDIFNGNDPIDLSALGRDTGVCQDAAQISKHEAATNTTARLFGYAASNTSEGLLGRYLETHGYTEHSGVCKKAPGIVMFIYNNRLGEAVLIAQEVSTNTPPKPAPTSWQEIEINKLQASVTGPKIGTEAKLPYVFLRGKVFAVGKSDQNYNCHGYGLNPKYPPDGNPEHHPDGIRKNLVEFKQTYYRLAKLWGWGNQMPFNSKNLTNDSTWLVIYADKAGIEHTALWDKGIITAKMGYQLGLFRFESLTQMSDGDYGVPTYMMKQEHPEYLERPIPKEWLKTK